MKYAAVIGIESHVQLKTKSKLFCACDNDARGKEPNTVICPVCLGLPGTLPALNAEAVNLAIHAGLALNGEIAKHTKFDRKNYFYPDLPKGYQITQYDQPIIGKGKVEVPFQGRTLAVGITRAHLEEDAGKLTHPANSDFSLVDLNRAGTPLLEIVSEPDLRTAAEAKAYATELYNIVRHAGVGDADLYHGNMRFDVNVSLRPEGSSELGIRTETKNINSFRAVERAAAYEIGRQTEALERGDRIVQETRGWDEDKGVTFSQRGKEEAHDYRYFPEPDLPPLVVTEAMLKTAGQDLQTPNKVRQQLRELELPEAAIETLASEPALARLLLHTTGHQVLIANWLVQLGPSWLAGSKLPSESDLTELADMVENSEVSTTAAKTILTEVIKSGQSPALAAKSLNLAQVSDSGELEQLAKQAIAGNPQSVTDYRAGKAAALQFLVGQVMRESKGQANPQLARDILIKMLEAHN